MADVYPVRQAVYTLYHHRLTKKKQSGGIIDLDKVSERAFENEQRFSKLQNVYGSFPSQNDKIAFILTQTFQHLGYQNKAISSVDFWIEDNGCMYRIMGISTKQSPSYSTLIEVKDAIKKGELIVTAYLEKDENYDKFIEKYKKAKLAPERLTYNFAGITYQRTVGVGMIRRMSQLALELHIAKEFPAASKGALPYSIYTFNGTVLTQKMDKNIIPVVDIEDISKEYKQYYSNKITALVCGMLHNLGNQAQQIKTSKELCSPKHNLNKGYFFVEKAFDYYLNDKSTDDVSPLD